jgi:hypothetical protein
LRHRLKAGHGAGKPTKKIIEDAVERFAFMMRATGTKYIEQSASARGMSLLYEDYDGVVGAVEAGIVCC